MQNPIVITDRQAGGGGPFPVANNGPQLRGSGHADLQAHSSRADLFSPPTERRSAAPDKIDESIAYMTQNLNRPVQVAVLAAMVGISPSHYFSLFKRRTGHAPIEYFTQLRMKAARRLLESTTSSVKEVAAALGYDDPFYFSRVFKSVNQLAPRNYRLKRQQRFAAGDCGCDPTTRMTKG